MLSQLISALSSVCSNSYEATLFTTAFDLAFFALLRVSEFTTSSKNTVVLHKSDVQLSVTDLRGIIKRSKTDQLAKGSTIQITLNSQTSTLFAHLNQYLTLRPDSPGPFFCHLNILSVYCRSPQDYKIH